MVKYNLYVFDMDGTLIDSSPGIINAVCHTLKMFNKNIPNDKVLASFIGPPLKKSFSLLPDVKSNEIEGLVNTFRKVYKETEIFNAKLYNGILQMCCKLSNMGVKMAVATNKPEEFAKRIVQYFQLDRFIPVVCGADMQGLLTKADLIKKAMLLSDEKDFNSVVMVGDTVSDEEAAAQCGVDFIGVTYGFGQWEDCMRKRVIKLANKAEDII